MVKAGDVVKVRVKDVDVARKRIALTMKSGAIDTGASNSGKASNDKRQHGKEITPRHVVPIARASRIRRGISNGSGAATCSEEVRSIRPIQRVERQRCQCEWATFLFDATVKRTV